MPTEWRVERGPPAEDHKRNGATTAKISGTVKGFPTE